MVLLFCIFNGQPFRRAFHVDIDEHKSVSQLRNKVKKGARKMWGAQVGAGDLAVHRATIQNRDEEALRNFYRELDRGTNETSEVYGADKIIDAFPNHRGGGLDVIFKCRRVAGPASPFERLHKELWGKAVGFSGIQDFAIEVPQPRFYLEPGQWPRMEQAGVQNPPLPITPMRQDKVSRVLQGLKTTSELPCGKSSLLIRSEYREIEGVLEQAVRRKWAGVNPGEDPMQGRRLDFEVSGQPGSGKTWFLSYILARRLLARQPTVYRRDDDKCYLFSEWSKGRKVDLEQLCALNDDEKQKLWILTDKALVDPEWESAAHPWFVVLAAAPRSVERSRQWEKDRNPGVRYIRNWEWHEIFAAFSLENPEVGLADINKLYTSFTCFGPVARTCLETIPAKSDDREYEKHLDLYLKEVDEEIYWLSKSGGESLENVISQNPSPRIALIHPSDTSSSYTVVPATRWVAHRMATASALGKRAHEESVGGEGNPQERSLCGEST